MNMDVLSRNPTAQDGQPAVASPYSPPCEVPPEDEFLDEPRRPGKKRAKIACRNCRRRKVRCDVYPRGSPCTNCRLDNVDCAVCEKRASRWCAKSKSKTETAACSQDTELGSGSSPLNCREGTPEDSNSPRKSSDHLTGNHESQPSPSEVTYDDGLGEDIFDPQARSSRGVVDDTHDLPTSTMPMLQQPENLPSWLTYDLSHTTHEDISYLQSKGCFSLPETKALDELLKCYFDYVHPHMPFIDETEFWEIYLRKDSATRKTQNASQSKFSLLVFQAMLFTATTCAPLSILKQAGYISRRTARRKAFFSVRALYSLDVERDNMALVQTFLLMSYWRGDAGEDKDAWHWSGLAISLAVGLGLHRRPSRQLTRRQETVRRRCWWSCVLRDRLVALSEQRRPRIRLEDSDVPALTLADYNVSLRLGMSGLSPGEELGKRTALSMFSLQLIRLMMCLCTNSPRQDGFKGAKESSASEETWAPAYQSFGEDKPLTGHPELDSWKRNLPEVLQRCPSSEDDDTVLPCILVHRDALHIYYHKLVLAYIMPRLLSSSAGEKSPQDVELAQSSSVALAKLHDELVDHDSIHRLPSECYGASTSTTGQEPRHDSDMDFVKTCISSILAGTRSHNNFGLPATNELTDNGAAGMDAMEIDGWYPGRGPTIYEAGGMEIPETASSFALDGPWPLGDDAGCEGLLPDIPDLATDELSISTSEPGVPSPSKLLSFGSFLSPGHGRLSKTGSADEISQDPLSHVASLSSWS